MEAIPCYKVYGFVKRDRSGRIRWLLDELGVPYESHFLNWKADENNKPEYLAIHPLGQVPALTENKQTFIESGAICFYLARKYRTKLPLIPNAESPLWPTFLQWMFFAAATLDPKYNEYLYLSWKEDDALKGRLLPGLREELREMATVLETELGDRSYLVGGEFSIVDIMIGSVVWWLWDEKIIDVPRFPRLTVYTDRLSQRPAVKSSGALST